MHRQMYQILTFGNVVLLIEFVVRCSPNDLKCKHPTITNGDAEPLYQSALPDGEYSDYYAAEEPELVLDGNYGDYDNHDNAEYSLHTELRVKCKPRYAFNGTKKSSGVFVCEDLSEDVVPLAGWSGDPEVVCSPVMCYPTTIPGGLLTAACDDETELSNPVLMQQTACLRCRLGYEIMDARRRARNAVQVSCGMDGEWMLPVSCSNAIACPVPSPPKYGDIISHDPLDHVTFRCHERFILVGRERLQCEIGKWNGVTPSCRFRASCLITNISNGALLINQNNMGDGPWAKPNTNATYRCDDGFRRQTEGAIRCRRGKWCPVPMCIPVVRCRRLGPLLHGTLDVVHGQDFQYGSVYRLSCQRGYLLSGSVGHVVDVTCTGNGDWSREEPRCEVVVCPDLRPPRHGKIRKLRGRRFEYNARYAVGCSGRYRLAGRPPGAEDIRTCGPDGRWTGGAGTLICEARKIFISREEWASFLSGHYYNCCPPGRELGYEWSPRCPLKSGVMTECVNPPWYKTDSTCFYREIREYDVPERVEVWFALLGVKVAKFNNRCCWVSSRLPPYQCYESAWKEKR